MKIRQFLNIYIQRILWSSEIFFVITFFSVKFFQKHSCQKMTESVAGKRKKVEEQYRNNPEEEFFEKNQEIGDTMTIEHYLTPGDEIQVESRQYFPNWYATWADKMRQKTEEIKTMLQFHLDRELVPNVILRTERDPRYKTDDVQRFVLNTTDGTKIVSAENKDFRRAIRDVYLRTYSHKLSFKMYNADKTAWHPVTFTYHKNLDWLTASETSDIETYAKRYYEHARGLIAPGVPGNLEFKNLGENTMGHHISRTGNVVLNVAHPDFVKIKDDGTKRVDARGVREVLAHELAHREAEYTRPGSLHGVFFHQILGKNAQNKGLGRLTHQGTFYRNRDWIPNTEDDAPTERED